NVSGQYLFENLYPGDYYVVFTLPAGKVGSGPCGGSDLSDSDPNRFAPNIGRTATTTLLPGENDMTRDAGVMMVASIGDRVWNDANDNGIQDDGELGVGGVTVQLYDSANTLIDTTTTNGSGQYLFNNLYPGDYYLVFTLPNGYVFSRQNVAGDDTIDSDPDRTTGRTATTNLAPGENDMTWDAGIMQVASLGDYVWEDLDIDG